MSQLTSFIRRIVLRNGCIIHSTRNASSNIRNVGIFAHIDAGKTTATERMLYYSGFSPSVGEVHTGDTVMDYMDQERDRGITITSAAITFPWNNHQINLIDTPGHVDFTLEVERSLRVLDGGILILDGSAGVQAQTLTVDRQAKRYSLPKIVFINKMDKPNASLDKSLQSLESKLGLTPLCVQYPLYGEGRELRGIIDLITLESFVWGKESLGKEFSRSSISGDLLEKCREKRIELIDSLCNFDDCLSTQLIESGSYEDISSKDIEEALRRTTLSSDNASSVVVLLGSAYKNIGVQPLMDGICKYLPGPTVSKNKEFLGMAFKIIHHPNKGSLTFVRIYSGSLKTGDFIYNVNQGKSERIQQLMIAFADDFHSVKEVKEGNIAVLSGLKESVTGDTLSTNKNSTVQLLGVPVPNPVMYCTIEPPSISQQLPLEHALRNLCREDPSFRVSIDESSGQTILSGMGELHLSIIRDRIESEYKVDADLGSLLIAYKEVPTAQADTVHAFHRTIGNSSHSIVVGVEVKPYRSEEIGETTPKLSMNTTRHPSLGELRPWQVKAIRKGFEFAISSGPLLSSSVVNAEFEISSIEINGRTKDTLISSAVSDAIKTVLKLAHVRIMEPIMKLEISSDPSEVSKISRDIIMKGGTLSTEGGEEDGGNMTVIQAKLPLADLRGYSQHLRTMTSGKANFGMELSHYDLVDLNAQNEVIKDVTGFYPR
eukprot:TRINITY_DN6525_c0_g1_i1.p1 TRINITY_DN6525_c0_g1~~TRINITY_DN6525_c0_g1_i1.p1  ORF type:complete len:715 (+),score=131.44 TRINITY_DN6525_c0_g1_i1:278-2422(+)